MDEELLQAIMDNFSGKTSRRKAEDEGEGDYRDFLANYMHAVNQGATDEDIQRLLGSVSPDRAEAMLNYGGGPNIERDPYIQSSRGSLNQLLRKRK